MSYGDYHIHTTYVDGANTAEEMVRAAISMGLPELGFSEHAWTPCDPAYSMAPDDAPRYRREIAALKEKYAGKIRILCGIELDCDGEDDPALYDYVIGSVHYLQVKGEWYAVDLSPEETLRCIRDGFGGDADAYAEAYFEKVSRLFEKTGANIIGHIDLIEKFRNTVPGNAGSERYIRAWRAAVDALPQSCAFEVNTGAISRGWRSAPYPDAPILRYLHETGRQIVLSGDAHSTEAIAGSFSMAEAYIRSAGFSCAGFTDRHGVRHTQI